MRTLVVYESLFGNTEALAHCIAEGLAKHADTDIRPVDDDREVDDEVDLIVLGGPTHAFSMSRPSTRDDAVRQGAEPAQHAVGLREWIGSRDLAGHQVALFDSRAYRGRRLPGSAAKSAARLIRRHGNPPVVDRASFYVQDVGGPLLDGEQDRARVWAEHLVLCSPGLTT